MNAYAITEGGRGYLLHGRYETEDGALRALLWLMGECAEIRLMGAVRGPKEAAAGWLAARCREVVVY